MKTHQRQRTLKSSAQKAPLKRNVPMPKTPPYNLMQGITRHPKQWVRGGISIDYRWGLDMLGLRTEPLMLYLLWKDAMLIISGSRSGGSFWYWKPMCL